MQTSESDSESGKNEVLRLTCVPAQHNSGLSTDSIMSCASLTCTIGRNVNDQGSTLWCGWVVELFEPTEAEAETERKRKVAVYFAG